MIRNYIIIACRNMMRSFFHSALNIFGLAIAIAFTLLMGSYVWNELDVNSHLKNADRQFIILSKWKDPNMGIELTSLGPLAKALKNQYPNLVANYYRWDGITSNISAGDKHFREGLQVGDSTFLNMYGFRVLYGDARTAFSNPFSVVLTATKARKYFGRTNAVGQTLTIENFSGSKHDFEITAVLDDQPRNSVTFINSDNHNQLYLPITSSSFFGRDIENWRNIYVVSYIELQKNVSVKDLQKPIEQLVNSNATTEIYRNLAVNIFPLKQYYLNADNGLIRKMLYTVSFVAIFILFMAIINYVNISISKSSSRLKEIGIRKVMGGLKKDLVFQFLAESVLLTAVATFFAFLFFYLFKGLFSEVLKTDIPSLSSYPVYFLALPLAFILLTGIFSGMYPALVLASLASVDSLKRKLKSRNENGLIRKTLVGFQFATAAIVFAGAIIVSGQVDLFFSRNLGYDKDYIISVQLPRDWSQAGVRKMELIRNEMAALPAVAEASVSYDTPSSGTGNSMQLYRKGSNPDNAIASNIVVVDEKFLDTYHIQLVSGNFFRQLPDSGNQSALAINLSQAKALGFSNPDAAIGQHILLKNLNTDFTIVGVTADFHYTSMQDKIQPLVYMHIRSAGSYRYLNLKLGNGNLEKKLSDVRSMWSALMPAAPFEYTFMDDDLKKIYQSEIQLKKASYISGALALVIALTGVMGLISLSVQKKTKEIGVRKVLGASVRNIIFLFLTEFLPVIAIGGLISVPVSNFILQKWLNGYVYRISINAEPFLISIISLGLVSTILIVMQVIRTALENPVKNLRTE